MIWINTSWHEAEAEFDSYHADRMAKLERLDRAVANYAHFMSGMGSRGAANNDRNLECIEGLYAEHTSANNNRELSALETEQRAFGCPIAYGHAIKTTREQGHESALNQWITEREEC